MGGCEAKVLAYFPGSSWGWVGVKPSPCIFSWVELGVGGCEAKSLHIFMGRVGGG